MKTYLMLIFLFIGQNLFCQSYKNLDKYRGFKEIAIGMYFYKYEKNIQKISKSNINSFPKAPDNEKDLYLYSNPSTNTIFGLEIFAIYLNTVKDKISNIYIIPRKPDDNHLILNFYKAEFGEPYSFQDKESGDNFFVWQGSEIAIRLRYQLERNNHTYCIIEYLESFKKVQKDK